MLRQHYREKISANDTGAESKESTYKCFGPHVAASILADCGGGRELEGEEGGGRTEGQEEEESADLCEDAGHVAEFKVAGQLRFFDEEADDYSEGGSEEVDVGNLVVIEEALVRADLLDLGAEEVIKIPSEIEEE